MQLIKGILKYMQLILKEKNNAYGFMIAWSYMEYEELVLKKCVACATEAQKKCCYYKFNKANNNT